MNGKPAAGNPYSEFNYTLNEMALYTPENQPQDYMTDVLSQKAADLFRKLPLTRNVLLFVATYAPHSAGHASAGHADASKVQPRRVRRRITNPTYPRNRHGYNRSSAPSAGERKWTTLP